MIESLSKLFEGRSEILILSVVMVGMCLHFVLQLWRTKVANPDPKVQADDPRIYHMEKLMERMEGHFKAHTDVLQALLLEAQITRADINIVKQNQENMARTLDSFK